MRPPGHARPVFPRAVASRAPRCLGTCRPVCRWPSSLTLRTLGPWAPGSRHRGATGASRPGPGLVPGGGGNGQPGPLLGPAAPPSTQGPQGVPGPESGAPGAVLWGEGQLAEGRAGHVPRVTQLLHGRAERQTGCPELRAEASTSASPRALRPWAQPLSPPQGLLRPRPPVLPAATVSAGPPAFQNTWQLGAGPRPSLSSSACVSNPACGVGRRPHGGRTQ